MNRIQLDLDGLTLLFAYLKMTGNVHWPWWRVVAPTAASVLLQLWWGRRR